MNEFIKNTNLEGEWYTLQGIDTDVVLSSRARLARNLAEFPFPAKFKGDDALRVQALVFDAFRKDESPQDYQTVTLSTLNNTGAQLLIERGLIEKSAVKAPGSAIVMRLNGERANSGHICVINDFDHIRIATFSAGLDCGKVYETDSETDKLLQKSLQFAASYDFGYLTSNTADAGSGMKLSVRVHLPSLSFSGMLNEVVQYIQSNGFDISASFGTANTGTFTPALGNFYQISTKNAGSGSETEQIALFTATIKALIEKERNQRKVCLENYSTQVHDRIYRTFSLTKFALLVNLHEGIQLLSDIKWGSKLGLFSEVEDSELCSLLYLIQKNRLKSFLDDGTLKFPLDIERNESLQIDRLRAVILHDSFENLELKNK